MGEWAIQIVGDISTLDRLRDALGPCDHIRVDAAATFLVRHAWQQAPGWEDVDAQGRTFVTYVNGLMRIRGSAGTQLRFGGVVLLKDGGAREFYESGTVMTKLTPSAVEEALGADGKPLPTPPDPLVGWLPVADAHPDLQDALRLFDSASDWFDLYKVYELVRDGLGDQAAVEAIIGKPTRSRLTQTMNHHRHADISLPAQPVAFENAERLVAGLLEAWLAKL